MPGTHLPTPDDPATAYRFERTLAFVRASLAPPARLLDLGPPNPLAQALAAQGFTVQNTEGDLDDAYAQAADTEVDAVTAFEILEHLVGPINVLRAIRAQRLFVTVPLRLWFAPAYRNPADAWDRHFHEFEAWQFDWLLEKAGWRIVRRERWVPHRAGFPRGLRPLLRRFTPRWYAVEAVRDEAASRNSG